jgi:hypothetical protein
MTQEEMDKQKAKEEADQSSQNSNVSGDPGSGADDKSKTVPLQALQEEREKRKTLQAELEKLKGMPVKKNEGEQLKIQRVKIDAKDLMDLTPGQLEDKINEAMTVAIAAAVQSTHGEILNMQNRSQVDRTIAKFAIFGDEDAKLANAALADLAERIKANPEKPLEDLAMATAKDWSKYKVASVNGATGGKKVVTDDNEPVRPGGSAADAAHINSKPKAYETAFEASQAALKIMETAQAQKNAAGK